MKNIRKPILAMLLICIMTLSTAVVSFASDYGDPVGKCIAHKYEIMQ